MRIPLPPSLARADAVLRKVGMSKYSDQLIIAMNRAAEQAVPEARALLVEAVDRMTIADAKAILTGPEDAATQYFRRHTEAALTARLQPIVQQATQRVRVAEAYNQYAGRAARFGLIKKEDADLNAYVTRKALDGTLPHHRRRGAGDPPQSHAAKHRSAAQGVRLAGALTARARHASSSAFPLCQNPALGSGREGRSWTVRSVSVRCSSAASSRQPCFRAGPSCCCSRCLPIALGCSGPPWA